MVPILLAFRFPGCALPPVQVRLKIPPDRYRFKVYDGFHRSRSVAIFSRLPVVYYASVAAGFTHLPVIVLEEGGVMKRGRLSKQAIAAGLCKLDGWSVVKGNLHRIFEFKDFTLAFGFMKRVARAADRMDHHPDWSNSYNKVTIDLSTHSAGGLTKNDFALASKIQKIHGR
jgi:4a-hydroxytetrahydrobiopterin dehydratase